MWYRRRNSKEYIMIFKWQEKVSSSVSLADRILHENENVFLIMDQWIISEFLWSNRNIWIYFFSK